MKNDDDDDLFTHSHSILARWRNHFSQLLNVHGIHDVWQTEIHTAEPPEPEPSVLKVEMIFKKLKRHKSPCIDQISGEMIKAGGRIICSEIHKLIKLLKPNGYMMHHQVQHSTTVVSAHTVFICFVFVLEHTATCATYTVN